MFVTVNLSVEQVQRKWWNVIFMVMGDYVTFCAQQRKGICLHVNLGLSIFEFEVKFCQVLFPPNQPPVWAINCNQPMEGRMINEHGRALVREVCLYVLQFLGDSCILSL